MSKFVQIESISMAFETKKGAVIALKDINLAIAQGECIAVMGPAGSGKSTLLNLLAGLLLPTAGVLVCNGKEVAGPAPERTLLNQGPTLLPWLSCFENVYLAVERVFAATESKHRLKQRTQNALTLLGLSQSEQKYPHEISGSMKQRVSLARALAIEPKVLLMDAPFAALDAPTRATLQDDLIKIVEATQTTLLMVTHDVDEAVLLADRIVLMRKGPAASVGEIHEFKLSRPRERKALANDPNYAEAHKAVSRFLLTQQGQAEAIAA